MECIEQDDTELVIHVGAMTGRQFRIEAMTSDTILDLKIKIYNQSSVDPDSQILLYGDKTLRHDSNTCQMENIKDGAKLQLVLDMNAGLKMNVKNSYKARFSLDDDIGLLEQLLTDLDVETAVKILNLLEEHPDILEEVLSSSSSLSPASSPSVYSDNEFNQRSESTSEEQIEEYITNDQDSLESRPSSAEPLKYIIDRTKERIMTAGKESRPTSTRSTRTRSSSISSEDLVRLLHTSPDNLLSRANSSRLRRMAPSFSSSRLFKGRPVTSMALTHHYSEGDIPWVIDLTRPPTVDVKVETVAVEMKKPAISMIPKASAKRASARDAKQTVQRKVSLVEEPPTLSIEPITPQKKSAKSRPIKTASPPNILKPSLIKKKSSLATITKALRSMKNTAPPLVVQEKKVLEPQVAAIEVNRCHECNKKTRISAIFKCRCGNSFCGTHRFNDKHKCAYDYKEAAKPGLARDNPVTRREKVSKI